MEFYTNAHNCPAFSEVFLASFQECLFTGVKTAFQTVLKAGFSVTF